jgi:hypothetical protein
MTNHAAEANLTPEQRAAKLFGCWPRGAPMERLPGPPNSVEPSTADPSVDHPNVPASEKINQFDYADEKDGRRVPRAAHIREMNPRADVLANGDSSARHRTEHRTASPQGQREYGIGELRGTLVRSGSYFAMFTAIQ